MTTRHHIALLALAAAALVAAAAWWLTDNPLAADAQTNAPEAPRPDLRDHSMGDAEPDRQAHEPEPLPALDHDHDEGFGSRDLWAHIKDPANSDLTPDLFAELSQLGADIVRADTTGQGRERWPHYWPSDAQRSEPCCTSITIHAAGAYTDPAVPAAVQVTVVWTAVQTGQGNRDEKFSQVHVRPGPAGWQPERTPWRFRPDSHLAVPAVRGEGAGSIWRATHPGPGDTPT